jgi:hypothetical protein
MSPLLGAPDSFFSTEKRLILLSLESTEPFEFSLVIGVLCKGVLGSYVLLAGSVLVLIFTPNLDFRSLWILS